MIQETIAWQESTQKKFDVMVTKIPLFHREIAREVVTQKAGMNAQDRQSSCVQDEDIVRAFFSEVPKAFYSLMVRLLDEGDFDYKNVDL